MNSSGDMAIGLFRLKEHRTHRSIFSGRRASGSVPTKPTLIQAGRDYHEHERYGDYSYTTPDPSSVAFWTIQRSAEQRSNPSGLLDAHDGLSVSEIKTNP